MQREKLAALGVEDRLDAVAVSGEVGAAKPDPMLFRDALDQLGVTSESACHVGDSLATDVAGAKAAGLAAVWLNRENDSLRDDDPLPDLEVASLRQLTTMLPQFTCT